MQMALRRLRKFARQGAAEESNIDGTIRETARTRHTRCAARA